MWMGNTVAFLINQSGEHYGKQLGRTLLFLWVFEFTVFTVCVGLLVSICVCVYAFVCACVCACVRTSKSQCQKLLSSWIVTCAVVVGTVTGMFRIHMRTSTIKVFRKTLNLTQWIFIITGTFVVFLCLVVPVILLVCNLRWKEHGKTQDGIVTFCLIQVVKKSHTVCGTIASLIQSQDCATLWTEIPVDQNKIHKCSPHPKGSLCYLLTIRFLNSLYDIVLFSF